VHITT